ncbi:TIGR02452 family protein [uncultured Ligilactobacillus sp.]|uniref:TIGR02452 family protein n=1 Tax=uncultured Ligilactobacillus sp. TaxID=2837633 RepID=UPI00272B6ADF|nr:TIGR02452 family protein [uncultured Ligilactobacillus sp.]
MDKATSDALGHKAMNLYQIQMPSLDQSSQLITQLLPETSTQNKFITQILVENKHLLTRLQQINATKKVGVMDFADPVLIGSRLLETDSQERLLCRNSFLYPELCKYRRNFYYRNKLDPKKGFYSEALIYVEHVKFLRDAKQDRILSQARYADVAAISPPNIHQITEMLGQKPDQKQLQLSVQTKILQTLRAFKQAQVTVLILGAFGCGAPGNDPKMVAQSFYSCLKRTEFKGVFEQVYFDIWQDPTTLAEFKRAFAA